MNIEALRTIASLLKELNIGELHAVREIAWDIKYALEQKEKDKLEDLIKETKGVA